MRISDWSSDVCSSDLGIADGERLGVFCVGRHQPSFDECMQQGGPAPHITVPTPAHCARVAPVDRQRRAGFGIASIREDSHADVSDRSEEHTSELQSLMRISYAVFCLKKTIRNTIRLS